MVIRITFSVLGPDTQEERFRGSGKFLLRLPYQLWMLKCMGCVLMLQSLA
ncbi:hypothetical protein SLEP1_g41655 [Rubroshorea leprosula]|nr:hypothetical protein SLEP1_g41655 [Rubroshorea leprosula]